MSAIYERIRRHLTDDPEADDTTIAGRIMEELRVPARPTAVLLPVVAASVRLQRRGGTRSSERKAFGPAQDLESCEDRVLARKHLMSTAFPVEQGRFVSWADATVAEHEARIEFLTKLAGGIHATIDRHREAIRLITDGGVSCLADLEGWAA